MSSRRKSRPVRRLHSTNGELLQSLDVAADANFEEQTFQGSLPTPESKYIFNIALKLFEKYIYLKLFKFKLFIF